MCGTPRAVMSPLAHLLLAAAVLHAATAAVPRPRLLPGILPSDDKPADKEAAPQLSLGDEQTIPENIETNLRAKPDDIPVEVIVEDVRPAIKTNEVAVDDEEIKRPAIDLRNPGPPQRQEHETQNADHFPDAQEKLAAVRDTLVQTQDLLRQGVKGVGDEISNWLSTNQQLSVIEQNIQTLRETFAAQIQKLNEAIKGFASPQASKPVDAPQSIPNKPDLQEVKTRVKILEDNFNNGVRALSEGVNIVAILRAEDEAAAIAAPATPAQPTPTPVNTTTTGSNIVGQFLTAFQDSVTSSLNGVANAFNTFLNRPSSSPPPDVQADTPDASTQRPSWPLSFQFPNFQNLLNGGQPQGQQSQTSAPEVPNFVQGFQNTIQGFFGGLIRPGVSSTAKPSEAGSNAVPQKLADEKQPEVPAVATSVPTAAAPAAPASVAPTGGPIRQIVQRIQSSISNPEKPRETEKSDDVQTKGGYYGGAKPGVSGDNNNGNGLKNLTEDPIKEDKVPEEIKKDPEPIKEPEVVDKNEASPVAVVEKTE